jgi:hypothetical protein
MSEQRNKVSINFEANSKDMTKQIKEIRKTSQASFAAIQQDQKKAAKSFSETFTEWSKTISLIVIENVKSFLDPISKSMTETMNAIFKDPNSKKILESGYKKAGDVEYAGPAVKKMLEGINTSRGRGPRGRTQLPFWEEIADMEARGFGKHIPEFQKRRAMESFDDGTDGPDPGPGLPDEWLTEPLKKLKKQAGPVEEQFNNVALAYRDQIDQVRSLLPAMKQAGAGMKGMRTSFTSMSGPALENFLGGLMRGKGGLTESLLAP